MMGGLCPALIERIRMKRYFKRPNGMVVKYDPSNHDLNSFQNRFKECNADGSAIKKPKPKPVYKPKEY